MSNLKTGNPKRHDLQDRLTNFIAGLDDCLFTLDEIKNHRDFEKISGTDFEILETLSESTTNIAITILKRLHEITTNKSKKDQLKNEKS